MRAHDVTAPLAPPPPIRVPLWARGLALLAVLAGAGAFFWTLRQGDAALAWSAYLIGAFFALGLGLFGAFWLAVLALAKGVWSVSMRRIPEAMTAYLLPGGVLALLVLFGGHDLYHWTDAAAVAADPLLAHKAPFLNTPLFVAVLAVSFLLWVVLAWRMVHGSRKQDETGSVETTRGNKPLAAVFVVLFAASFSLVSYFLLMSLEPHWFSTMYAVLTFTDLFQTGLAFVTLVVAWLIIRGDLAGFVNQNHLHSVAKMMFALTGFWAYIYFCQFLLIWYANIPEEVVHFSRRWEHGWLVYLALLPVLKFVVPFVVLVPRAAKRNPRLVMLVAAWILVAQLFELFLLVGPTVAHGGAPAHAHLPVVELLVAHGFFGLFFLVFSFSLASHNPVPLKDPRLRECLELRQ
jgi:hypothetical protein